MARSIDYSLKLTICRLYIQGLSGVEIGKRLGMSRQAVHFHIVWLKQHGVLVDKHIFNVEKLRKVADVEKF